MAAVNYDLKYNRKRKREADVVDVETISRIDDLNDTLLELIFTRLSLWRYVVISKCVSKRWNSIISNPGFSRQLRPQSLPSTLVVSAAECLVTEHPYFLKNKFRLDFIPSTSHDILASTNDLIVAYSHINSHKKEFYVANPFTKQYVVVPIPLAKPIRRYQEIMVGIAGFFDGFRIVLIDRCPKLTVRIYSSETGQWKTYLFDRFDDYRMNFGQAITWNNKIHWKICSKIIVIDPFNIDNEAPRVVNLPTEIGNYSGTLSICQNRLRIVHFEQTTSNAWKNERIKIWEIEDYDTVDDYSVKVKLVMDFEVKRSYLNHVIPRGSRVVCCHPTDPQVLYLSFHGYVYHYNFVDLERKYLGHSTRFHCYAFVLAHPP